MGIHHSQKSMAAAAWARTAVGDPTVVAQLAFTSGWDAATLVPSPVVEEVISAMLSQQKKCGDADCFERETMEHIFEAAIKRLRAVRG